MDVWGYLAAAGLIALIALGLLARRWSRNFARKAQENLQTGRTADQAGFAFVDKAVAELAVVAHFDADLATVAAALAGIKPPLGWKHPSAEQWMTPMSAADPTPGALAILEPDGAGTRFALARGQSYAGLPTSDKEWKKLRTRAIEAARSAGITTTEQAGPALVRTPLVDVTGIHPGVAANLPHAYDRPGYFPGPTAAGGHP
jgi:hypothetical protein